MYVASGLGAYEQVIRNTRARTVRMPAKADARQFQDGGIFPILSPKFHIRPGETIFTIGSCFARHVEHVLMESGFRVPVAGFTLPAGEFPHPAPHLLNEYNAGTIVQRIESVVGLFDYRDDMGIENTEDGAIDLFLHIHTPPVPLKRLLERRAQIRALYDELRTADVVVITLGLVECWWDRQSRCYLNKAPSRALVTREQGRFEFHQMDVPAVYDRMSKAIGLLQSVSRARILLTVSPVPVEATFMPQNVVMSNSYSKSVLRVAAEMLVRDHQDVDYFPSYEIVTSFGTGAFEADNTHVDPALVRKVTSTMVQSYRAAAEPVPVVESLADLYHRFWAILNQTGDLAAARRVADQMNVAYPDTLVSLDTMGHWHSAAGDHAAALACALAALTKPGAHAGCLQRVAAIYEALGQPDAARTYLAAAA
jgi:hypothetical protein